MSQIVIGVDVDHLVQRSELGVPEGTQLRMLEARRQALLVALLELGLCGLLAHNMSAIDTGERPPDLTVWLLCYPLPATRCGRMGQIRPPRSYVCGCCMWPRAILYCPVFLFEVCHVTNTRRPYIC